MMNIRPTGGQVVFGAGKIQTEPADKVQEKITQALTAKGYKVTTDFDDYVNDPSNQVVIGSRSLGINPSAGPILIMVNMRPKNPDPTHKEIKALVKTLSQIPGATPFKASGSTVHAQFSGNINNQMVSVSELIITP